MNKKSQIQTLVLIIFGLLIIFFWIFLFPKKLNQSTVIFKNKTFEVELAQTDQERQKWLMYRKTLDENKWMLFVFQDPWTHSFWMKNTLIPLDMIWIGEFDWQNRVVDIQTAKPCTTAKCEIYEPAWNSLFVLEINAWLAQKYWIKIGDVVDLRF